MQKLAWLSLVAGLGFVILLAGWARRSFAQQEGYLLFTGSWDGTPYMILGQIEGVLMGEPEPLYSFFSDELKSNFSLEDWQAAVNRVGSANLVRAEICAPLDVYENAWASGQVCLYQAGEEDRVVYQIYLHWEDEDWRLYATKRIS